MNKISRSLIELIQFVQNSIEQSFFRRLSTSLLITLTLLSAVPLILVVFFMRSVAIESTREIIRNQNSLIAKRAANEIKLFLNTPDILLNLLSGIKDVKDMNPLAQNVIINKILQDYHPIFNKVFVLNKSGKVISTTEQKLPSVTYANEKFFINTIKGKRRYLTHVKLDYAHKPFIIISYPIVQSGQIIGVLAGEVNIEKIWELVDEIKIGKTGNAFIIGSTGQAIAHQNKYNVINEIRVLGENIIDKIKKNAEISLVFDTPQGETMLGTFVHIRDFEWTMALQQPLNDYSDIPSALLYYEVLAFIVLVILIAVLIASLLKKRITEPINSLISGVKRYAEGDLSFRINIERYEEIAVLAEEFNSMASNLYKNQEKLRGVERLAAMSKFATLVSHEIRNPLNSMNINMKILKREIDNPKGDIVKKQKYFNIIASEINRMDNLIKNFLMIARPPRFDFVLNDIQGILEEVILLHLENSKQQNVSIIKEFQDGKSIAKIDCDQMKQVFHNIIINALQAMPDGGELRIQSRLKKMDTSLDQNVQFIRIKFIDTGIGIPEDKIKDIFEIYHTMKKTGTGLGLAIARQIVEGHFGSIDVKSKVGEGTTITVSIPTNSGLDTF